jgi:putative endonuclease
VKEACLTKAGFSLCREMVCFVYIIQSDKDGSYYIGHTSDLEERLERHNEGRSAFTRSKVPWKLIYQEFFTSKSEAMKREKEIKRRKSRKFIQQLVSTRPG